MISSITLLNLGFSSAESHPRALLPSVSCRRSNSMKHCWNSALNMAPVPGRGAVISRTISSNARDIGSSELA